MFEYTGNDITAYYFNKVVFNTYLTDKERNLINALDYFRYDTMKTEKQDFPHLSWTTAPASGWECTNLSARFWLMIMECLDHVTELYANDNKDKPDHVIEDLRESLKGITPKAYSNEIIANNYDTDMKGNSPLKSGIKNGDFSRIEYDLEQICKPMLLALETGEHAEQLKKAHSMIKRKTTTIGNYAIKEGIV